MNETYLAVDLGGTNVKYGLVTTTGQVRYFTKWPVDPGRGSGPVVAELVNRLKDLLAEIPSQDQPRGLAVGVAGIVNSKQGLLVFARNLPGWRQVPLAALLEKALGLDTRLENDANLYALGEYRAGAGRGLRNFICITLGTGVGGGLILDGRLWKGPYGTASEVGHLVVEPQGLPCSCGGRGCLETLASARAIENQARLLFNETTPVGSELTGTPTTEALYRMAKTGNRMAADLFGSAGRALGVALAGVFNLLGLEGAIIGGGVSAAFEFLYPTLYEEFSSRLVAVDPLTIRILPAQLGDTAPLLAAPVLFGEGGY
jgi:glucokinase